MFHKDRWLWWSWDGEKCAYKKNKDSLFKFHCNISDKRPCKSYKEELFLNAEKIRQEHTGTFDVFLSGGIDSEVVVRTFNDLKIKHNTYIIRYENNLNKFDVDSAIDICTCLGINYKLIDFNLQYFFENDAHDLFKKTLNPNVARLPHLKFCDLVDNIPVMGDGEPYWKRELLGDYTKKSKWHFIFSEESHISEMYLHHIGRENVLEWYEYSPQVTMAFNELPIIGQLLNDGIPGKHSSWSSRIQIHQEIWPDIKPKPKLVGYEGNNVPGYMPEFIVKLQNQVQDEINESTDFKYTLEELNIFFNSCDS